MNEPSLGTLTTPPTSLTQTTIAMTQHLLSICEFAPPQLPTVVVTPSQPATPVAQQTSLTSYVRQLQFETYGTPVPGPNTPYDSFL
ncbi:hypothetical protein M8J76_000149 [Diaphorina citri]|nr:hypothetical protein M8J76_000149 [Diaphorina citri]